MWESGLEVETETDWECCWCNKVFTAIKEVMITYVGKAKDGSN